MAAIQFEMQAWGRTTWTDVSERIGGQAVLTEGRSIDSLGGGLPTPRPSTMNVPLDDTDGYFSMGDGRDLSLPGALIRVSWAATDTATKTVRFQGQLSARRRVDNDIIQTEWAGPMWKLSSSQTNRKDRLFIRQTAAHMFTEIAQESGIDRDDVIVSGTSTRTNRLVQASLSGIQDIEAAYSAFAYDTPDGKLKLELPSERTPKTISHKWTDLTPTGDEKGIRRPSDLLQAFGIVNRATVNLEVFAPARSYDATEDDEDNATQTETFSFSGEFPAAHGTTRTNRVTINTEKLLHADVNYSFWMRLKYKDLESEDIAVANPALGREPIVSEGSGYQGGLRGLTAGNADTVLINISDTSISADGGSIILTFGSSGGVVDSTGNISANIEFYGFVTAASSGISLDFNRRNWLYTYEDEDSIERYGERNRSQDVRYGFTLELPFNRADGDDSDATDWEPYIDLERIMRTIAQDQVDRNSAPRAVYEILHDDEPSILARRLSDKETLRLRDGTDDNFFVEAMETTIHRPPQILQKVWYATTNLRGVDTGGGPQPTIDPSTIEAPLNPRVEEGYERLILRWDPVPGAVSYNVNWGQTASTLTRHVTVQAVNGYEVVGLTDNFTIFFRVRAVSSTGVMSDWSTIASGTTLTRPPTLPPVTPLDTPGMFAMTGQRGKIQLSWTAVPHATAYEVNYGISATTLDLNATVNAPAVAYEITGLQDDQTRYARVRATATGIPTNTVRKSSPSGWTTIRNARTLPAPRPRLYRALVHSNNKLFVLTGRSYVGSSLTVDGDEGLFEVNKNNARLTPVANPFVYAYGGDLIDVDDATMRTRDIAYVKSNLSVLYSLNLTTGIATRLGTIGSPPSGYQTPRNLAFRDNKLYMFGPPIVTSRRVFRPFVQGGLRGRYVTEYSATGGGILELNAANRTLSAVGSPVGASQHRLSWGTMTATSASNSLVMVEQSHERSYGLYRWLTLTGQVSTQGQIGSSFVHIWCNAWDGTNHWFIATRSARSRRVGGGFVVTAGQPTLYRMTPLGVVTEIGVLPE